jgi:hypothetical protein
VDKCPVCGYDGKVRMRFLERTCDFCFSWVEKYLADRWAKRG